MSHIISYYTHTYYKACNNAKKHWQWHTQNITEVNVPVAGRTMMPEVTDMKEHSQVLVSMHKYKL